MVWTLHSMFVQGIVKAGYSLSFPLLWTLSISHAVLVTALLESISHLCVLAWYTDSNLPNTMDYQNYIYSIKKPIKIHTNAFQKYLIWWSHKEVMRLYIYNGQVVWP